MKRTSTRKSRKPGKNLACILAVSLLALAPTSAMAGSETNNGTEALQQSNARTVSGRVVDATGEPVIGASIVEKGNPKNGVVTDVNGHFTLNTPPGAKLIVSYIGFKQLEVTARNDMKITMSDNSENIDEVVVVAYGTRAKKSLTGSLSQVNTKDIQVQNTTTVSRALEGSAPGIQIASVDGQPGFDTGIRIRGVSSANGDSSNALVVVDGVMQQTNSETENPLSRLNPDDIADITILKDAASTALYGSRAANGVILITTKSGQSGKARITFDARWGWNSAGPHDYNSMNSAAEIYEYAWKCIYNSYRYGVNNGLPVMKNGVYTSNVNNPNHSDEEARLFASQHLFDYTGSETNFQKNALGNDMAYFVPGATYTITGKDKNSSATMSGAYLVDPTTGRINPNARLLYNNETMEDLLLQTRFRQQYNVSASGGNERMHYYFSLGYQDDPSYVRNSKYRRYSGRANMDALVLSWLKIGTNVGYSNTQTRSMAGKWGIRNIGASSGNTFEYVLGWSPLVSYYQYDKDGNRVYDANGNAVLNFGNHRTYSPLGSTYMQDGNAWGRDLLKEVDTNYQQQDIAAWTTRTYAEAHFLKYFTFRNNFNMDENNFRHTKYMNSEAGRGAPYGGMNLWTVTTRTMDIQQLLTYSQDFNKVHHVDAMFGHEYESIDRKNVNIGTGYELLTGEVIPGNFAQIKNLLGGTGYGLATPGWGLDKYRTEAYFGNANYSYAERYYASATLRRDGASKFRKDKRWGTFWSIGGGWRLSDEAFMKPTRTWLDNAKLRFSYGVTGNSNGVTSWYTNNIWTYGVASWKTTSSAYGTPSTFKINAPGSPAQDDITWENVHQFDLGLDFSVLNSRITGSIDYYNNLTVNSLFAQAVSPLANLGQASRTRNCAKIRNAGIELELGADIIRTKDFTWHLATNGTHYRTTLVDVPEEQKPYWDETIDLPKGCWTAGNDAWASSGTSGYQNRGTFYLRGEHKDLYNLYIFKYAGVDENTGLPMYWHRVTYADVNKGDHDGRYASYKVGENVRTNNPSDASRYEMGTATPDWIGGFSTSFRYKDFDLSIVAAYQLGGKFLSVDYGNELYSTSSIAGSDDRRSLSRDVIGNTWTPENKGAYFPMQWWTNDSYSIHLDGATFGGYNWTDMSLFSASYLRIKNITFGYTMPKTLTEKIGIARLRAYLSLDNMFLFSKKAGLDPSLSTIGGMEVGSRTYPQMKTVTLGLNLEL